MPTPPCRPADWTLQPGQQASWPAAAGDEMFCAAGAVRIEHVGSPDPLPACVMHAGQTLRAPAAGLFRAEAVFAARGRLLPAPVEFPATAPRKRESLRPFGRRLSWMFGR